MSIKVASDTKVKFLMQNLLFHCQQVHDRGVCHISYMANRRLLLQIYNKNSKFRNVFILKEIRTENLVSCFRVEIFIINSSKHCLYSTMGLQSNLNKTPKFFIKRVMIQSNLGSENNRS